MKVILALLIFAVSATPAKANPPEDLSTAATIAGSKIKGRNIFQGDQTAFIAAIDGNKIKSSKKHWQENILVSPGKHQILVSFSYGSYRARTELTLDAALGHSYRLMASSDAKWRGGDYYCDFWIIDLSDGKRVTETKRVGINYTKIIFVP